VVGADGVISRGPDPAPGADPGTDPDVHVAAALATVEDLDRSARVVRVAAERNPAEPSSRPFWADLVGDSAHGHVSASAPSLPDVDSAVLDVLNGPDVISADTDLIITSLPSAADGDHASDLVALAAARLLRVGGVLAVITHSDSSRGELVDSTGVVVASAQNADLLYLQHIVALHVPARDGRFATELIPDTDRSLAKHQARTAHRAAVRGLPAPHRRIHSDVLVFAQPHEHEHEPLVEHAAMSPAEQARETGVIR
jgi:hypothetical protein